jgi:hypothetical protein
MFNEALINYELCERYRGITIPSDLSCDLSCDQYFGTLDLKHISLLFTANAIKKKSNLYSNQCFLFYSDFLRFAFLLRLPAEWPLQSERAVHKDGTVRNTTSVGAESHFQYTSVPRITQDSQLDG